MRVLTLAAVLAATAIPAIAKPVTYFCEMEPSYGGWIGESMALQIDKSNGTAKALDGVVYSVHEEAIPGKLIVKGSQTTVSWRVLIKDSKGQTTNMDYRATLLAGNKAVVSARPGANYKGRFQAKGTCQPTNERFPGM
ncbi:MAG: hypothetical protein AAGF55_16105 [Pseudomonadota bacterium]